MENRLFYPMFPQAHQPVLEMSVSFVDELMGCFPQMEELVGARNPHASNDLLLLLHRLPGPNSAHDHRKYNLFYLKKTFFFPPIYLFFVRKMLWKTSCVAGLMLRAFVLASGVT